MAQPKEFDDADRRSLFGASAAAYGDGRPGYPDEVFQLLTQTCGLGPGCSVLEIGPGSGQATGPLLDAGASVVAVETAEEFADGLQAKYGDRNLDVIVGDFATAALEIEPVDLAVAATSFHWIDPAVGLARVADLLRPGGSMALWWTHYGDPNRSDPFREAVQPILRQHAPQFTDDVSGGAGVGAHPYALDVSTRILEIDETGRFGPVSHTAIPWTASLTGAQIVRFLASFSHWMALDNEVRNVLLQEIEQLVVEEFDGSVQRPYLTTVFTAQRDPVARLSSGDDELNFDAEPTAPIRHLPTGQCP